MRESLYRLAGWGRQWLDGWDRFWFTPAAPHTLAMIRIFTGAMLFYTHLVLALDLLAFLGRDAWITADVSRQAGSRFAWSYLWYVESPTALWMLHLAALLVFALLTLGLFTRVVSVLAWLITIAYCHRLQGALFGLDQINAMLAMYLMVGPSGAVYSLDRWRAARRQRQPRADQGRAGESAEVFPRVSANVAIRLIQLHMCIIYLFGGIGKMRGELWWDGSAFWYSIANLEYQSLDVTWLVGYPLLIALLTHITVFWETFYCFLVWPRLTRPLTLFLAVCVHGGIALCLGMVTFGTAMLIGNFAFVSPDTVRRIVAAIVHRPAPRSRHAIRTV
jgi:hypothetical protein